ncbi:MAG: hypothetical protein EOO65_05345 [Methanosarcinales archaeon]|nr:MAG: hypothetical protein EOO65_05345 [Methanosarcinales archaeon]
MLRSPHRIPIEICPTSNALTLHLPDLRDHPTIDAWIADDYPFSVCTDDSGTSSYGHPNIKTLARVRCLRKRMMHLPCPRILTAGVFSVSLTDEFVMLAQSYELPAHRIAALARAGFMHAFIDEPTRSSILAHVDAQLAVALTAMTGCA